MADEANATTTETPPAAQAVAIATPPAPSEPTVPEGQVLIDSDRLEKLERSQKSFNGAAPSLKAAASLGYKTPEQLGEALTRLKTLDERGIDVSTMFRPDPPEPSENGAFDADAFETRIMGKIREESAMTQHQQMVQDETRLIESLASELAGKDASDRRRAMALHLVKGEAYDNASRYPDEHPISGNNYFQPHDSRSFETVAKSVHELWREASGQTLVDAAKGEFQPSTNTKPNAPSGSVAGAPSMSGPNGQASSGPEKPMYLRSKSDKVAAATEMIKNLDAASNQHPMSQA